MGKGVLLLFMTALLLTGCSSYLESNNLAIVVGMGIDYDKEEKEYNVTLQIVNPSGVAQVSSGKGGVPVLNINGKGRTLSEASRNASKSSSRVTLFSHLSVLVLSEEFAREVGINFILDVFERDAKVRTNNILLISREQSAENLLSVIPIMDSIPSASLSKKLRSSSEVLGQNVNNYIHNVIGGLSSRGMEPVINGAFVRGDIKKGASTANKESLEDTNVTLDGIGMFRDGLLVGWLEGDKAKSLPIITNQIKSTDITASCPGKKGTLSAVIRFNRSKAQVKFEKDKAHIKLKIYGNGYLNEILCNLDFEKAEVLKQIEEGLKEQIEKDVLEGIQFAQNNESDIFGFGEMLHRAHPNQWKKAEKDWNEKFAEAEVEVETEIYLYGTGMRTKAYPF